jgi:hypothetical protein
LTRLEEAAQEQSTEKAPLLKDELLNVRQAAAFLKIKPEGMRNARRQGRVQGVRLNEKEWGFFTSELHRYLNRYKRYNQ